MDRLTHTRTEVDEVLEKCYKSEENNRSKFPGMTYEQGVENGIKWLLGEIDDNPMDD